MSFPQGIVQTQMHATMVKTRYTPTATKEDVDTCKIDT